MKPAFTYMFFASLFIVIILFSIPYLMSVGIAGDVVFQKNLNFSTHILLCGATVMVISTLFLCNVPEKDPVRQHHMGDELQRLYHKINNTLAAFIAIAVFVRWFKVELIFDHTQMFLWTVVPILALIISSQILKKYVPKEKFQRPEQDEVPFEKIPQMLKVRKYQKTLTIFQITCTVSGFLVLALTPNFKLYVAIGLIGTIVSMIAGSIITNIARNLAVEKYPYVPSSRVGKGSGPEENIIMEAQRFGDDLTVALLKNTLPSIILTALIFWGPMGIAILINVH